MPEPELRAFSADQVAWEDIPEVAEVLWEEFEQEGPTGGRRLLLVATIADLVNKLWDDYERDDPGGFFECRTHDPTAPAPLPDCADGEPCEHGVRWDWVDAPPDLWSGPKLKLYLDLPGRPRSSHLIISPCRGAVHVRTALAWEHQAYRTFQERAQARKGRSPGAGGSGS